MNAKQILTNYNITRISESLLDSLISIKNPVQISKQYRDSYILPLQAYFEYKFKTIGARIFDSKSFKVSAGIGTEISDFRLLSETEQQSLLNSYVFEFFTLFPKMSIKRATTFNDSDTLELLIMPYGQSDSLIYQEFKKSKRTLFIVRFLIPPINTGIYCQIRFNSIVGYFSELMEIDIYHSKKTQRILTDVTEEDFERFVVSVKGVIDRLAKAVRLTMSK